MDLSNKVAIVTGSGRGLGLAYAKELAAAGRRRRRQRRRRGDRRRRPSPRSPPTAGGRRRRGRTGRLHGDRAGARAHGGRELRPPRRDGHQRRHPARQGAVEDDRRGLRRRHRRPPAGHLHLRARGRRADARAGRAAAGSSASARPPASAATSARPTTPPPRRASSAWSRTWAMELQRAGITVNAVVPVAATAMTETIPFFAPVRRGATTQGEPMPPVVRREHGFGTPEDVAGAGRVPRLGRRGRRHRPGDRHRRRPARALVAPAAEIATAFARRRLDARTRSPPPGPPRSPAQLADVGENSRCPEVPPTDDAMTSPASTSTRSTRSTSHPRRGRRARARVAGRRALAAAEKYFKARRTAARPSTRSPRYYRERNMAAVVFTVDAEHGTGHAPDSAATEIAERRAEQPDVLIPFGSRRPAQGRRGRREARRLVDETASRASSSTPACRASSPTTGRFYPLYEAIEEAGLTGAVPHRADRHRRGHARRRRHPAAATPTRCCSTTSPPTSRT